MLGIDAGGVPITSSSQIYRMTHCCHFPPRPARFSSTWVGNVTVSVITRFDSNSFATRASSSFNSLDCWRSSVILLILLVATFFLQTKAAKENNKYELSFHFITPMALAMWILTMASVQLKKWCIDVLDFVVDRILATLRQWTRNYLTDKHFNDPTHQCFDGLMATRFAFRSLSNCTAWISWSSDMYDFNSRSFLIALFTCIWTNVLPFDFCRWTSQWASSQRSLASWLKTCFL